MVELKEENKLVFKIRENPWIVSSAVLGIAAIILLAGSFAGISATGNAVSSEDAEKIVLDILQEQGAEGITIDSVEEVSGVYEVDFFYNGKQFTLYLTKDGKMTLQPVLWEDFRNSLK